MKDLGRSPIENRAQIPVQVCSRMVFCFFFYSVLLQMVTIKCHYIYTKGPQEGIRSLAIKNHFGVLFSMISYPVISIH